MGEIRVVHAGSRGTYRAPRIHAALRRAGRAVNSKKVERLMRQEWGDTYVECGRVWTHANG
ncbi:IS3 family transposase [Streptomyces sp. st115]|uniref:IS3 family transposase n=1 Tax=Streptomyces sp. st115 TaxID=1828047 RepID=UPI0015CF2281|nr:IS3 family transposase [Streptomyces sp. st115]